MIGIIASMDEELYLIKKEMKDLKEEDIKGSIYFMGNIDDKKVVAVKCLTGKVAMACTAQKLIDNFAPNLLINCGVAGGLKTGIEVGDVVLSTKTVQSDMDVTQLGYEVGCVPDIDVTYFEQDRRFNEIAEGIKDDFDFGVYFGNILTADKFVSNNKDKEYLIKTFDGYCTDMETASLAQVCHINNISFAGIRGISDSADEGASTDFKENLRKASDNCAKLLIAVLKKM